MGTQMRKSLLVKYLAILGALNLYVSNIYASTQDYIQTQDLQKKALQLQQEAITTVNNLPTLSQTDLNIAIEEPTQVNISVFPITTKLMTPGMITPRTLVIATPIVQPIFLVGSDTLSQTWLKQNLEKLQQLHAIGFLVQAQNESDLDNMQRLANNLSLTPLSGDSLAQSRQLDHYPVLITTQGIIQ